MFSINDTIKKYVRFNPEIFAYTMLGLSTSILVYFVANNDESTNDKTGSGEIVPDEIVSNEAESNSEKSPEQSPEPFDKELFDEEQETPVSGGSKRRKSRTKKTKRKKL
jgi:hypothetical protein